MKFKEIRPGMVIHCPKEEDAEALLEHLDTKGYIWEDTFDHLTDNTRYDEGDTYFLDYIEGEDINFLRVTHDSYDWAIENGYTPTEFSDLIEPDSSPMTAVEVLEWLGKHYCDGVYKDVFGYDYELTKLLRPEFSSFTVQEIVDKITAYEAAKKAPKPVKVKEGYYCDIYTEDEQIINYIMYGVDEQTATADAREKAIQNTMETGSRTFADVKFVCEEDES